ncbi:MAG: helix-turn-helix domain-containing protein [Clostridia bacterium]|jgi:excisionase family DNA binding protein|nr:helix-turn-helix domain-containing protein [Clostridia bacterium]
MNSSTQCKPAETKRTYTVDEIAKILNIGRTTAYALVKEGHFKIVRIGSAIRISKQSFDEWLDRQEF